jgi:hypothetical protein
MSAPVKATLQVLVRKGGTVVIKFVKNESGWIARLGSESGVFDALVLPGLDGLELRPATRRHVTGGDRGGLWQIRCGW